MNPTAHSILVVLFVASTALAQTKPGHIPPTIHARILQLEDERDLGGNELINLLEDKRPAVRERAALALGRIGDARATPALIEALNKDQAENVRMMAAFALGEMEDQQAMPALIEALDKRKAPLFTEARLIEALGKLGSMPAVDEETRAQTSERIARLLPLEASKTEERLAVRLAIAALMRLRSPSSVAPLARQLRSPHAEIRADAANALFRLRRPMAEAVAPLLAVAIDSDIDVRAHAARALGASGDGRAFDPLIKLLDDGEARVRVSAVRGLQLLGDRRAIEPLISSGEKSLAALPQDPSAIHILLEIATALGNFRAPTSLPFLQRLRASVGIGAHPEVEIALARLGIHTRKYDLGKDLGRNDWRRQANLAAAYAESSDPLADDDVLDLFGTAAVEAVPAILRAMHRRKLSNVPRIYRAMLETSDLYIRATAAALFAESHDEVSLNALIDALATARKDSSNDARLAIVQSLAQHKSPRAIEAVRSALTDRDYLVRRAAIAALKNQGANTDGLTAGPVRTGRSRAFYERIARNLNRPRTAVIETERGAITLELFTADAPLTVENFTALARRGFFNGIAFHRVVANFVIQGGDPRGDGEGGPGHQIRCEINLHPYARGALGMALSGKDTGGSQFFITHSPQPHLDGGYTVFGRVTSGQQVVDRITRGDLIRRVVIK